MGASAALLFVLLTVCRRVYCARHDPITLTDPPRMANGLSIIGATCCSPVERDAQSMAFLRTPDIPDQTGKRGNESDDSQDSKHRLHLICCVCATIVVSAADKTARSDTGEGLLESWQL
jgi:hypothetical protein